MSSWRSRLSSPLHYSRPQPGGTLNTLADARAYILEKLSASVQRSPQFNGAAELLLAAAEGTRSIDDATLQMRLALQWHGALVETKPSANRN